MSTPLESNDSRHQPLIPAITDFYQLLAKTCYIQSSDILYPPHGPLFNPSLGLEQGFSQEAVDLLSQLPYLTEKCTNIALDGYSTNPISYLTDPEPEEDGSFSNGDWGDSRDPTYQGEEGGMMIPPYMFSVTHGNLHGEWLLYDLISCTLRSWSTMRDKVDETSDIEKNIRALPPTEVFQEWAAMYQKLEIMAVNFYGPEFKPECPEDLKPEEANLAEEWNEEVELNFEIGREEYSVDGGLSRMYGECGWDVDDVGNDGWNPEEFIKRRNLWFESVYSGRDHRRSQNQKRQRDSERAIRLALRATHFY